MNKTKIIESICLCSCQHYYRITRRLMSLHYEHHHECKILLGEEQQEPRRLTPKMRNMIKESDWVIFLLGPVYGNRMQRKRSVLHDEFEYAAKNHWRKMGVLISPELREAYFDVKPLFENMLNSSTQKDADTENEIINKAKPKLEYCKSEDIFPLLTMCHIAHKREFIHHEKDIEKLPEIVDEILFENFKKVITESSYIRNEDIKNLELYYQTKGTKEIQKYPYVPRKNDVEYANVKVSKLNQNLGDSIKRLFLLSYAKNPLALKDFIECSNEAKNTFVTYLTSQFEASIPGSNNFIFFIDPAIELDHGDIWLKDKNFNRILYETSKKMEIITKDTKHRIYRIFIFKTGINAEIARRTKKETNIGTVILLNLTLGIKVGMFRESYLIRKYHQLFNKNNLNFYLISNTVLNILDIAFPYIRMYEWNSDIDFTDSESWGKKNFKEIYDNLIIKYYSDQIQILVQKEEDHFIIPPSEEHINDSNNIIDRAIKHLRKKENIRIVKQFFSNPEDNHHHLQQLFSCGILQEAIKKILIFLKEKL